MASRVEKYLAHLDRLSGTREPGFFPVESTKQGLRGVTEIVYDNLPDGLLTALTYGLSLAEHPDWQHGSPELCLSVNSTNVIWAHAVGFLAEQLRGTCPFSYGGTINFGERIVPESEMTAFCVFAPLVLDREDYLGIDVGIPGHEGHDVINIQGMYPIHEVERQFINEYGLEAFWKSDWEPTNVLRRPAI
ncbi:suppressor of fused domain protein [Streptomyces sp. NBC_00102]|uniref:suppressor of fused domain protein n=1 Tax=Streptomyces sp. NBC_00102 TaxID=2975652 RepID=UPI002255D2AE|nr:suppressor of fused domain protein [Streptomyces sp. NBC_00102]MCX5402369.1 suppressor of fused domain protein [Streptomyces sp. NBC_00102]